MIFIPLIVYVIISKKAQKWSEKRTGHNNT
jgi:hypothetical protein